MTRRHTFWTVIDILVVIYALLPVLWILSLSLKPTSTVKDGKLIPSEINASVTGNLTATIAGLGKSGSGKNDPAVEG